MAKRAVKAKAKTTKLKRAPSHKESLAAHRKAFGLKVVKGGAGKGMSRSAAGKRGAEARWGKRKRKSA
jgi:hypothetical protein